MRDVPLSTNPVDNFVGKLGAGNARSGPDYSFVKLIKNYTLKNNYKNHIDIYATGFLWLLADETNEDYAWVKSSCV